jgi:hypothetical protein
MSLNLGANYCTNFTLFSESRKDLLILVQGVSSLFNIQTIYLLFAVPIHRLAGVSQNKNTAN